MSAPIFRTVGYLKRQMVVASLMTAGFGTAMAAVTYERESMGIAFTILAGLAIGWIEMVTIVVTGLVAPPNDIGVAQGFFGSTRLTFGTVASKPPMILSKFGRNLFIRWIQSASTWQFIAIG